MNLKHILLWAAIALASGGVTALVMNKTADAPDTHAEQDEHGHGHEEGSEDSAHIEDESARAMNITVLEAGPATVRQTISLTGKVTLNQDKTAQILARFPGVIKSVRKSVGESVKKGEVLATVESNTSLQTYSVISPLDGVVISRNASVGGSAGDAPVYVVADLADLWAEFFVFSRDMDRIQTGQTIDVVSLIDSASEETEIFSLLPVAETSSQTVVARVVIDNKDKQWRAGMTVRGDVVLAENDVALAVKTSAIQRQEGGSVVYVKDHETYAMRPVETGRADREWTEVLSGLRAGEAYVAEGSFIVKADIGKASAEHAH